MEVRPSHIYLIPPRSNLIIEGTTPHDGRSAIAVPPDTVDGTDPETPQHVGLRFSLLNQPPRPVLNKPIDVFFHSLADAVGDRAVAVILSGTGSDGSRGLRAVKDADGFVIVQDPETAAFDGMPRAAISTHLADVICPPERLERELSKFFQYQMLGDHVELEIFEGSDQVVEDILTFVSDKAEIDFLQYKSPTLKRRILRRMQILQCKSLEDYLSLLRKDESEAAQIHREFLVGVTDFFRDYPVWAELERTHLKELFEHGTADEPLKIWSVGCSTGEEAYTLAMMVEEFRKDNKIERDFRVLATDVNDAAIRKAKNGIYTSAEADSIPDRFRGTYFTFREKDMVIAPTIRNKIVFSTHNIIDDTPYIRTDLILCRNLLIYLSSESQAKTLALFSFSLRQGGLLVLGASESADRAHERFRPENGSLRIYRNIRNKNNRLNNIRDRSDFFAPIRPFRTASGIRVAQAGSAPPPQLQSMLDMMQDIDVTLVIASERLQIIETFGNHSALLTVPEETFSANLLDLLPSGLRSSAAMLIRAAAEKERAEHRNVRAALEGGDATYNLFCRKVEWPGTPMAFSFCFQKCRPSRSETKPSGSEDALRRAASDQSETYIAELETELEDLRSFLGASMEELAVTNEELQTSNEELMATNEELQATNEEIQSVNEELHTVNAENHERIEELVRAKADIENILENADTAMILLDKDLGIRRFSSAFKAHFDVDERDIGRPLSNFASRFDYSDRQVLLDDAAEATRSGKMGLRELNRSNGEWHQAASRPFRKTDGSIDGAIITVHDVTKLKTLQEDLKAALLRLEGVLESQTAGYWDWNLAEGTDYMSPRFKQMFGYEEHELTNVPETWQSLIHPDDLPGVMEGFNAHVETHGKVPFDKEVRYFHKDGSIVWVICRGAVTDWDKDGKALRMVGCHIDITALKEREARSLENAREVRHFSFIAAHDLREPINGVHTCLEALEEDIGAELPEAQRQLLDLARERAVRTLDRISGVLDYARLTDDEMEPTRVDMTALFETALQDVTQIGDELDTEIEYEVRTLPHALGSTVLLGQVVHNIISNAVKFRCKERRLQIVIDGTTSDTGEAHYWCRDNGIGIPSGELSHVFDIFTRLHTQREYAGNGLGLALCSRIVNLHSGHIWAADHVTTGAEIHFTLPAAD